MSPFDGEWQKVSVENVDAFNLATCEYQSVCVIFTGCSKYQIISLFIVTTGYMVDSIINHYTMVIWLRVIGYRFIA